MKKTLTDNDRMPFGKFKNEKMANMPAKYLLWLHDNNLCGINNGVQKYIEDNMEVLQQEVKNGN